MSSSGHGPGVRKFWDARAADTELDLRTIVHEYPDEALALADAIRQATAQEESETRERMWRARARVLGRVGEDVTLGALLRQSRQDVDLSPTALSAKVEQRGTLLHPTAIEHLEADRVAIMNVRTAGLWLALATVLRIDRHRLVAAIQAALVGPHPAQRFTRMDRGTKAVDRERFIVAAGAPERDQGAAGYIEWVRGELGLPSAPTDAAQ